MPVDQPPAIVEQVKPGKTFSVYYSFGPDAAGGSY